MESESKIAGENNKHVDLGPSTLLTSFNNFLQAHLPPGNLSTHSDVFDGAAFSTLLSIDCSLLSTVGLFTWR